MKWFRHVNRMRAQLWHINVFQWQPSDRTKRGRVLRACQNKERPTCVGENLKMGIDMTRIYGCKKRPREMQETVDQFYTITRDVSKMISKTTIGTP